MDGQLPVVLVAVDQPFDFDVVVLLEDVNGLGNVVPHLGFDLPTAVGQGKGEIRLAAFLGFHLFGGNHKAGSDDLVFAAGTIGYVKIFHDHARHTTRKGQQGTIGGDQPLRSAYH